MLRTWDESSKAQKAVSFNCLDFEGTSVTYNWLPSVNCPSGIRAQIVRTLSQPFNRLPPR